mmetsp:Transcript_46440/g.132058  ORF Transcript_46440/g.132058 Transcript_46440/m.132058 type:complete len:277 (-) Transcript_46440:182-1012(-)
MAVAGAAAAAAASSAFTAVAPKLHVLQRQPRRLHGRGGRGDRNPNPLLLRRRRRRSGACGTEGDAVPALQPALGPRLVYRGAPQGRPCSRGYLLLCPSFPGRELVGGGGQRGQPLNRQQHQVTRPTLLCGLEAHPEGVARLSAEACLVRHLRAARQENATKTWPTQQEPVTLTRAEHKRPLALLWWPCRHWQQPVPVRGEGLAAEQRPHSHSTKTPAVVTQQRRELSRVLIRLCARVAEHHARGAQQQWLILFVRANVADERVRQVIPGAFAQHSV